MSYGKILWVFAVINLLAVLAFAADVQNIKTAMCDLYL